MNRQVATAHATSQITGSSIRRRRPRARTMRMPRREVGKLRAIRSLPPAAVVAQPRPRVWGDCQGNQGPCPWVGCAKHLYLDVNPDTGSIKVNFPGLEPWELNDACSVAIAEAGALTLEDTGERMNLTRERVRQIEAGALRLLRRQFDGEGSS